MNYEEYTEIPMVEPATVGPVTIHDTDTAFTVTAAFILAIVFLIIKAAIEYQFAKWLELYKLKINPPPD